jgi:hypothetical protein
VVNDGGGVELQPTTGIGMALANQVTPGVWMGGEVRYFRSYEGARLETFTGQALYVGPTLYAKLGKKGWLSAAFSFQLWGGAESEAMKRAMSSSLFSLLLMKIEPQMGKAFER